MPNFKRLIAIAFAALAVTTAPVAAQTVTIPVVQDVWQYPFNFSEGFNTGIQLFGAANPTPPFGPGSFNYHDGAAVIEFGPSFLVSSSDYAPGSTASSYDFDSVTVTVMNVAQIGGELPFEWDLSSDFGVDDNGSSIPLYINIHGVEFTAGTAATFSENDDSVVSCPGAMFGCTNGNTVGTPRDPFPLNVDDSMTTDSDISNLSQPGSWASSVTTPGYVPGVTTDAFPIVFELDISNPRVKTYIQEGLASGDLFFSIISNANSGAGTGGAGAQPHRYPRIAGNPSVPGSNADSATITFTNFANGNSSVSNWDQY